MAVVDVSTLHPREEAIGYHRNRTGIHADIRGALDLPVADIDCRDIGDQRRKKRLPLQDERRGAECVVSYHIPLFRPQLRGKYKVGETAVRLCSAIRHKCVCGENVGNAGRFGYGERHLHSEIVILAMQGNPLGETGSGFLDGEQHGLITVGQGVVDSL
jgi:hypothetical protein